MSSDSRSSDPYGSEVQALLADAVRDELAVRSAVEGLSLSDAAVGRLADAVSARLDYAFRFT